MENIQLFILLTIFFCLKSAQSWCPYGRSGSDCRTGCHCNYKSDCKSRTCNCAAEYYGTGCNKVCPYGRSGRNCHTGCHCNYKSFCKFTTCYCADGYYGTGCNEECPHGRYGNSCQSGCPCIYRSECTLSQCTCDSGDKSAGCMEGCPFQRSGPNSKTGCHCLDTSQCVSLQCTCAAGYQGTECNEECSPGTFGSDCQKTCNCADNSTCNKINGRCSDQQCKKGYTGIDCQTLCPYNRYGNDCQHECHCNDTLLCTSKTCSCSNGWKGTGCNVECPTGTFGFKCQNKCNCADNSTCDKINGWCPDLKCEKGYRGENCKKRCESGTFGDSCHLKCHCVNNSQCNYVNGKCLDGKCADGYKGVNCQEIKSSLTLPLILGGVLIFIISIGIVIACCRWRKSKRSNDFNNQETENNIPMERGNFQETEEENIREAIVSENIYQNIIALTKDNLLFHVQQKKMDQVPFSEEFSSLINNDAYPSEIAKLPENCSKHRYKSVLPYDHSRVILSGDEANTDFINANYINEERNYIATQGPLKTTTKDFWRMIWQEECNTIVMLTNIVENGKTKSYSYWPDLNETENHGTFKIRCIEENHSMIYIHRVLTITQSSTQEKRTVYHFQCTIWPDYGVIEEPTFFLEFRNAIHHSRFSKPPFVVHCSAGVGRTGTYIALDILLEKLWTEPNIDVFSCVDQLRHQRTSMVQKINQYEFIYDVLAEEVLTGFSEIIVNSIPDEFRQLQTMEADGRSMLQNQYEDYLSPLNQPYSTASNINEPIYANVNEYEVVGASHEFLPEPTFLDGFNMQNEIMLMPQPSKNTAEMFWEFIYKRRCSVIVMFEESSHSDEVYWPEMGKYTQVYKSVKVELVDICEKRNYIQRNFNITSTKQSTLGPVAVLHYTTKIWQTQQLPSPSELIEFICMVNSCCGQGKQILIHSKDGINKSGLFAILCVMLSKIKMNEYLSILRLLRYAKKKNSQIASDDDSYRLCWSVAEKFLDNTSIYSNQVSFTDFI